MIEWFLALLAIPVGLWLRQAASDELNIGRIWIKTLAVLGCLGLIAFLIINEQAAAMTCLTAVVIAGISLQGKKSIK